MKLFVKLLLGIMAVVTVAVGIVEYMNISITFRNGMDRERDNLQEQYLIIEYMLRLYWSENIQAVDMDNWDSIGVQVEEFLSEGYSFSIYDSEQKLVYGNRNGTALPNNLSNDTDVHVQVQDIDEKYYMTFSAQVKLDENACYLQLGKNVTVIFLEKTQFLRNALLIYLIVLAVCTIIAYFIAYFITSPIKKLQQVAERMAGGKHNVRTRIKTTDEIGELAKSFDIMAATVEENMERLERQAREKEDFVANFAHELKTPLTSIIGYADLIYQEELSADKLKLASAYIINEGMRLESMSYKLMELSSLSHNEIEREIVSVSDLFENISETAAFTMEQRSVRFFYNCESAYINIDFNLFKSLILNLLDNASKSQGNKVLLAGRIKGDCYQISVTDNGIGMPKEEISRIEEAFYMVDKARSRRLNGAGIGLALSAKIANAHDTCLKYNSTVGEGTTVSIDMKMEDLKNED